VAIVILWFILNDAPDMKDHARFSKLFIYYEAVAASRKAISADHRFLNPNLSFLANFLKKY
jgi:hypothetical protein